jgi:hypothetical protein
LNKKCITYILNEKELIFSICIKKRFEVKVKNNFITLKRKDRIIASDVKQEKDI